jgi:dipeptidyl aminopeptidase/acylaminoacyl peptidase
VQEQYSAQYRCQFLEGKTEEEARERMIASSPLHFALQSGVEHVVLDHGSIDSVVPVWNANEMHDRLHSQGMNAELNIYQGFGHGDLPDSAEWRATQERIYNQFLGIP